MLATEHEIITDFQQRNPRTILGMQSFIRGIFLKQGSSPTYNRYLDIEIYFAEEINRPLAEALNHYQFKAEDFPLSSDYDLILAVGIINHGLSLGLSFRFLLENITTLLADPAGHSSTLTTGQQDSRELINAHASAMFALESIEFREAVHGLVRREFDSCTLELDPGLKIACFSALLTFLQNEKEVFSLNATAALTTSSPDLQETIQASAPLAPENLLVNSDRDDVFQTASELSIFTHRFAASLLTSAGKVRREALPRESEKQQAVTAFLENPDRLEYFFKKTFSLLNQGLLHKNPHGYPDHDRRHILFCVPVTALRLGETKDSYSQIFGAFCALMHDAGRIVEALYPLDDPRKLEMDKMHPEISTACAATILEEFPEIPKKVKNEILLAITTHDSLVISNSQLACFIASCDRLQLVGPEFFLRQLYLISCYGKDFYPSPSTIPTTGDSVFGSTAFYLNNLRPNIGAKHSLESRLRICSGTILQLAALDNEETLRQFFPSDILLTTSWQRLPQNLIRAIQRSAYQARNGHSREWPNYSEEFYENREKPLEDLFDELFNLPLVSKHHFLFKEVPGTEHLRAALARSQSNTGFQAACRYAIGIAKLYDREQQRALAGFQKSELLPLRLLADQISTVFE